MKPIKDMTVDEMKAEIRALQSKIYDKSEPYAFISYSHLDAELVYSKVLMWMREGYNIYIDLDFENHASNAHWVDLMKRAIKNINCVQMIAFRSINHAFSYASFMELQTSRSEEVVEYLKFSGYTPMDIDIINVGDLPVRPWQALSRSEKAAYNERFDKLRQNMGSCFGEKNEAERRLMNKLLNEWNVVPQSNGVDEDKRKSVLEQLDDSYKNGAVDFYSMIYNLTNMWLQKHDLIGNYKDINSDMSNRLEKVRLVELIEKSAEGKPCEDEISITAVEPTEQTGKSAEKVKRKRLRDYAIAAAGMGMAIAMLGVAEDAKNMIEDDCENS